MTQQPVAVAVLDDYQGVALSSADWSVLAGRAEVTVFTDHLVDPAAVAERLRPFDVVVVMRERTPLPAAVLDQLPRLRLVVTSGMANASVDRAAADRLGVVLCGTGGSAHPTPELAWALLMALARSVAVEDAGVRAGRWGVTVGRELAGATLGLVGLGRIGSRMARYAQAFDMHVLAWSQNLTDERAREVGVERVTKPDLFARADIVSIHTRISDRTIGLVGAAELDLLGRDGLLVNTSRGPIVDEAALVAALSEGRIAGAALDVFDVEPLPAGHPLLSTPHTLLTPHVGYVTREAYAVYYGEAVDDIRAWLDGTPVRVLP